MGWVDKVGSHKGFQKKENEKVGLDFSGSVSERITES